MRVGPAEAEQRLKVSGLCRPAGKSGGKGWLACSVSLHPPEVYLTARINFPKIPIRVWGSFPERGSFIFPCFGGMFQAGAGRHRVLGTGSWAQGPSHPQHVPLRDRAGSGSCCEGLPLHYRDAREDEHGEGVARA